MRAEDARDRVKVAKETSIIWAEEMCKSPIFPAIRAAADEEKYEVSVPVGCLDIRQQEILETYLKLELGYDVLQDSCYRDYDDEWHICISWK